MLDTKRLARLLSLSGVLLGAGLPTTGCCDPETFEISAGLSVPFPGRVLERAIAVRALGDRVRLEFSEPVRATSFGVVLGPCDGAEGSGGPPFAEDPEDVQPPVGGGGASGGADLGGAAGADAGPEPLGGAGGLGGQGGMSSADPPESPPTVDPPTTTPPPGPSWDGYSTCVEIIGYNISQRVQVTRREERYGYQVSVKGTAFDEVEGCGAGKPEDMGIVLELVE